MSGSAAVRSIPNQLRLAPGIEARTKLLDAAEALLSESGLQGASLRQISAAAGQGNTSAVQYHFGGKAGLVQAIIARRVSGFEPRRRALLEALEKQESFGDIRELLRVLYLPLAEATDANGRHVYIRFLMQFNTQIRYETDTEHPGWAPESVAMRAGNFLMKALPFLSRPAFALRIGRLTGFFLSALIDRENAMAMGRKVESESAFLADLFTMMAAALSAPAYERSRRSGLKRRG